ncbi:MAG: Holliday junction DNA helicase RuvA [Bdellovibrionales bacterium RIFOXYD1_FULL_53_11]|nr:MAG: Holliday junction DNA helicase RuvA [Bdellovibrionales bacterium RIFOXYD1_FULL_53_11]
MIGYIAGRVAENSGGRIIICVGNPDSGGEIGYSVNVPQREVYESLQSGARVSLFVHTHVREDVLDLFGFKTKEEKEIFHALLSVSGIGPKGALNVLSGAEPAELVSAIVDEDKDALLRMPGIGKKTAERIVVELAGLLKRRVEAGLLSGVRQSGAQSAVAGVDALVIREAGEALAGLGYSEREIKEALERVAAGGAGTAGDFRHNSESLLKAALRAL